MSIFNIISLLGGLAMFLYGMRMMGDGLKENASGPMKKAMETLTNTPVKAFLSGLLLTAVIQSSTATIVITSGLVGAGIITLHQSLGIIVGANVGTTVTGQIIRLLDLDAGGTSLLQFFKPSTLAPLALIIGIVLIMAVKNDNSETIGKIAIGFGILFSGLLNMTDAVDVLTQNGMIEGLFMRLGESPVIGYLIGAGVAFVLQSSSATIGILQAFSTSGLLTFSGIYAMLVGVYLGDCVTTAIVCNIGARPDAKRVGIVNIVFNLAKSLAVLVGVGLAHRFGLLDNIWDKVIYSGGIANTNSLFNLVCAILLFPLLNPFEKLGHILVKDSDEPADPDEEKFKSLSGNFLRTPAIALDRCRDLLLEMFELARTNIHRASTMLAAGYDAETYKVLDEDEERIDRMTDRLSNYLVQLSASITDEHNAEILNNYISVVSEFERLGDHATNIAEIAKTLKEDDTTFSPDAMSELTILFELLYRILDLSHLAFADCNQQAARHIEPLEEVVDDMVNALKNNHLNRLREGSCSIVAGTQFWNLLSDAERISDICSNIGVATVVRARPELKHSAHDYVSMLHTGNDDAFNKEYKEAHECYFRMLASLEHKAN